MRTILINLFTVILLINSIHGDAQDRDTGWLGIETDPISTALGARTVSVIIEPTKMGHWSIFLNVVSADFPGWMDDFLNPNNKGKGFESKIRIGGGFAVDYFPSSERHGLYFGLLNLFFQNEVNIGQSANSLLTHNIIPRIGYRWYPVDQSKIYINPFLGMRYEYIPASILSIDDLNYSAAGIQPFGTIHIGYHF